MLKLCNFEENFQQKAFPIKINRPRAKMLETNHGNLLDYRGFKFIYIHSKRLGSLITQSGFKLINRLTLAISKVNYLSSFTVICPRDGTGQDFLDPTRPVNFKIIAG